MKSPQPTAPLAPGVLPSCVTLLQSRYPALTADALFNALETLRAPQPPPTDIKALSPKQVAARLGCSRATVFRLMNSDRLPRIKLGARTVRISDAAVTRLLQKGAGVS